MSTPSSTLRARHHKSLTELPVHKRTNSAALAHGAHASVNRQNARCTTRASVRRSRSTQPILLQVPGLIGNACLATFTVLVIIILVVCCITLSDTNNQEAFDACGPELWTSMTTAVILTTISAAIITYNFINTRFTTSAA